MSQLSHDVEMEILPRTSDIGNFEVKRALPFVNRRLVGPFIFWDQIGPGELLTGRGIDVRPHPHIGLSTVTYLLEGSLDHKDSLGSDQRILPGDVNLMTAGSGIVHSERTGQDVRKTASPLWGVQSWLAQPKSDENGAAGFVHAGAGELPRFAADGVSGTVILGAFEGLRSPVATQWDTLYLDLEMAAGSALQLPRQTEERALYALGGQIEIGGVVYEPERMLVLRPGDDITLRAVTAARIMVLGGAVMDGPRYIFWNFVASSQERLEQAKRDWKEGHFPKVPGDSAEFIPLPG